MRIYILRDGRWDRFIIPQTRLRLLDVLTHIRTHHDETLAYRRNCGAGMCGSCAVTLDGHPVLACKTWLTGQRHFIEPLQGYPVIRDLVVDFKRLYGENREALHLIPEKRRTSPDDILMRPEEVERVIPILWCIECGVCTSICTTREFGWGACARTKTARNMLDIRTPPPPEKNDNLYRHMLICTSCGRCEATCPMNLETVISYEQAKERLYEIGASPYHARTLSNIKSEHNAYGEPHEGRVAWLPSDVKFSETPKVAVFVGCTASYRRIESARATVQILHKLGIPFTIPKDEWCCGSPLLRTGLGRIIKDRHMPHNVQKVIETGAETLITPCSGCAKTWRTDYARFYGHMPFETKHITEYLADLVKDGIPLPEVDMQATYHDPCHLGRGIGVYDAPREVIQAMGIDLIEMPHARDMSACCGAGGGVKAGFKEIATSLGRRRVMEAKSIGVDTILTSCVFCVTNLMDSAVGTNIRTFNIERLLAERLMCKGMMKERKGGQE